MKIVSEFGKSSIFTLVAAASVLALGITAISAQNQADAVVAKPAESGKSSKGITRASQTVIDQHIDQAWVKKAMFDLLDHWRDASVMPNGFIQENLDRQWKPWGTQREASLNGQGRQLYTMVEGYEYSHDKKYLDAMTLGAGFLLKMHDDQYGGYFNRTTPDLAAIDDTKTGFQTFVIFPLANAFRVTKDSLYEKAAMDQWHVMRDQMRDGQFFKGTMKRDFSGPATSPLGGRESRAGAPGRGGFNPGRHSLNVHMFEALLALYDATKSKEVWDEITAEMAEMEKLYDYNLGYLPEGFDENWKSTGGTNFNVGHLFEWASLFSRAVELGADPKFVALGGQSIDLALKISYNKPEGGVWMNASVNGDIARKYMIWWTECETLKATARYAILHGRSDLWPYFDQTLVFVKKNFLDTEYGGWFEGVIPGSPREALGERAYIKGAVDGPEWGSYHQTTMFTDLLHLSSR
jgi:mannobiose 2-epimerase